MYPFLILAALSRLDEELSQEDTGSSDGQVGDGASTSVLGNSGGGRIGASNAGARNNSSRSLSGRSLGGSRLGSSGSSRRGLAQSGLNAGLGGAAGLITGLGLLSLAGGSLGLDLGGSLGGSGSTGVGVRQRLLSLGDSGRRGGRGGGGVIGALASLDLDALPATRLVAVDVFLDALGGSGVTTSVVSDLDVLVVSVEGTLGEVGVTASPLDSALGSVLATSTPGAELDLHGGLGVVGATLGVGGLQLTNRGAINEPVDRLLRPLDGVGVVGGKGVGDGVVGTTVVGRGVTLGEVVGLDLLGITTNPLPVDLVEIVGLEDQAGHDTLTGGCLDLDIEAAEEDVLSGGDGRGVALLSDLEVSTLSVVRELSSRELRESRARALGEIAVDQVLSEGRVSGAGCYKMLASQFFLSEAHWTGFMGQINILFSRGLQSVKV